MDVFLNGMHFRLHQEHLILLGAAGLAVLVLGMTGAWLSAYFGARRAARKALRQATLAPAPLADAKLTELTRMVDTMALEVERIAEAQRFLVKLLSEREVSQMQMPANPPIALPRAPGNTTPH